MQLPNLSRPKGPPPPAFLYRPAVMGYAVKWSAPSSSVLVDGFRSVEWFTRHTTIEYDAPPLRDLHGGPIVAEFVRSERDAIGLHFTWRLLDEHRRDMERVLAAGTGLSIEFRMLAPAHVAMERGNQRHIEQQHVRLSAVAAVRNPAYRGAGTWPLQRA